MVALLFVFSKGNLLLSFFRACSTLEVDGDERWDDGSRTGRYREDFRLQVLVSSDQHDIVNF